MPYKKRKKAWLFTFLHKMSLLHQQRRCYMGKKITMQNTSKNITISEAWKLFIRKKQVNNLSPSTLKTYQRHYDIFTEYINEEYNIDTITVNTIDSFIIHLRNTNIKPVSINSYLRTIRTFLYWCMENDYLKKFKIQLPKTNTFCYSYLKSL